MVEQRDGLEGRRATDHIGDIGGKAVEAMQAIEAVPTSEDNRHGVPVDRRAPEEDTRYGIPPVLTLL